jgi:hypothetical protein
MQPVGGEVDKKGEGGQKIKGWGKNTLFFIFNA